MNPTITAQDASGVYALMAFLADKDACAKRLRELQAKEASIIEERKKADAAAASAEKDVAAANIRMAAAAVAEGKNQKANALLDERTTLLLSREAQVAKDTTAVQVSADSNRKAAAELERRSAALEKKEQDLEAKLAAAESEREKYENARVSIQTALQRVPA